MAGTFDESVSPGAAFFHRGFVLFVIARFLSIVAFQVFSIAVVCQVYDLTHRPLVLGYVGLAQFLPGIALALFTGYAADRFDRRRLLVLCQLLLAMCALLLWTYSARGGRDVKPIYFVLVLSGIARAFRDPALQALMPDLVPLRHFNNAVSWSSSISQGARVIGPALGGAVYGWLGGAQ